MAANSALVVSSLSFDALKSNFRSFLQAKPEFKDFDFEDSAIGTLLDLLAYNTYYNSFYTNMAASESFMDSAQLYDSVVSHAKTMGYTPTSAIGATANVRISFTSKIPSASNPTLTIPENTMFTSTINGVAYSFVTPKTYTVSANSSNRFRQDVELVEGYPLTYTYTFASGLEDFVFPNENVDTRSIKVTVSKDGTSSNYIQATDIMTVNSSSKVFFLSGDRANKYRIQFGDNSLGLKPDYNSTVSVAYRVCNATKGNGANNFTASGTVAGETNFTLSVLERASGGAAQESADSVKFNAPKNYETQNRAVTVEDYQRIILRDNPDLAAINVWGGQDNDPPIYGKVYAAAKPAEGTLLSSTRKSSIISGIKRYNVQSISFEMVDPTFLYIVPKVTIQYDSTKTSLSTSAIASLVAGRIIQYETNNFARFDSKFWFSRFLNYLDLADNSIVGSSADIFIQKRFSPLTSGQNTYTFKYFTQLDPNKGYLSSSSFTYKGYTSMLDDEGFDGSYGSVSSYYLSNGEKVHNNHTLGTIDYDTGTIVLNNFYPTAYSGDEIKINVKPYSPNFEAVRNQLLFFADSEVVVKEVNSRTTVATLTTIATAGQSATTNDSGIILNVY
jgi:hypothetical protein